MAPHAPRRQFRLQGNQPSATSDASFTIPAIREASKRSGVACSPHVFRHTAGVWMAQADVPIQKIAQFLGHTSTRVTERTYARYSPSFMKDAAAALDW